MSGSMIILFYPNLFLLLVNVNLGSYIHVSRPFVPMLSDTLSWPFLMTRNILVFFWHRYLLFLTALIPMPKIDLPVFLLE